MLEAYFARLSTREARSLANRLRAAGMLAERDAAPLTPQRIVDPGWASLWKARFKPIAIGRRLIILPPWQAATPSEGRTPVIIDPGQGFGTGHHGTTRGTLLAIEKECSRRAIRDALDLGTGSGILAFAMKRLGVEHVLAVDIDPQALENARHNAVLNGLRRGIRFTTAMPRAQARFELIAANILSSTLIGLAPKLKRMLAPGGRLILSGILARESRAVAAAYRPELHPVWSHTERGWTTLVMGGAVPGEGES